MAKSYYNELVKSGWAFESPVGSPVHSLAIERAHELEHGGHVFVDLHKGEVVLIAPDGTETLWTQRLDAFAGPQRKKAEVQEKRRRKYTRKTVVEPGRRRARRKK